MKNWKYINGAEGVRIGNGGITVDSAVAKEIRELAGKHWNSGIHDSRTLALTVAFELAKKYDFIRETKDDFVSKAQKVIDDFIKQTKTGNDTPAEYAKRPAKIVGGNSLPEELEKDVEKKDEEKVEEVKKLEKVGNQSPQERLNQDLSIIKEECRKKGTSLSFSELAKELEKYGWDFNELRKLKLPVSVGNASSDEEYWKKQYIEAARKKGVPEREIQEFIKKIEKEGAKGVMIPVKNSASDDKFAYVMREFDEGKLKTPDGKVVTDPAQAKAIAYSESKKTENGLARARNAIKK